jgi:hypothetical protein
VVDIGHSPVLETCEIGNQGVIDIAEGYVVVVALAVVRLPRAIALRVPVTLRQRVELAILGEIEPEAWDRCMVAEKAQRDSLVTYVDQWKAIWRQDSK